jgi:hypothetical protein
VGVTFGIGTFQRRRFLLFNAAGPDYSGQAKEDGERAEGTLRLNSASLFSFFTAEAQRTQRKYILTLAQRISVLSAGTITLIPFFAM